MKKFYAAIVPALGVMAMAAPSAFAQEAEFSASVDFTTEYVFRGVSLGAESVQPGLEVAIGDFYAGVWGSTGVGEESVLNADEVDFYAGYGFALSDTISADVGGTIYHYPQAGDVFDFGDASTFELYGGLALDSVLAPSAYLYYDVDLETFTIEAAGSHSFDLAESTSFDVSASVGSVSADGGGDYQYGSLSAALSYAVGESSSIYASASLGVSSEDTFIDWEDLASGTTNVDSDSAWLGIGFSTTLD